MVTTHSSLVLNYLDDEVAREGVFLLYKDAERHIRAVKLSQLRALAKKLGALGPGEAMSDTDLANLDYEARVSRVYLMLFRRRPHRLGATGSPGTFRARPRRPRPSPPWSSRNGAIHPEHGFPTPMRAVPLWR